MDEQARRLKIAAGIRAAWASGKYTEVVFPGWTSKHKRKSPQWNKGLTKVNDSRVAVLSERASVRMQGRRLPPMTTEQRLRLSRAQSANNRGGKTKWFCVNGEKVQGTWERGLALAMTEQGIEWTRPSPWKYTTSDGLTKHYTPDFYLPYIDRYV